MVDVSVLVPTHRHAALLPYALASTLDQQGASVEVLVVGDGVDDATREALVAFEDDPRVRIFDRPKGPSRGEAYRHEVLAEARGRVVCYLSDDDLHLPDHAATMCALLEDADFTHSASAWLTPEGALRYHPWDVSRPEFAALTRWGPNAIGLTSAAHTLAAYRRLPHGWRTTPPGQATDRHMWLQWLEQPWLRAVSSRRLTHLQFPDGIWRAVPEPERAAILRDWLERSRRPGFREELDGLLHDAVLRAGEKYRLEAGASAQEIEAMRATRAWRLRERLVSAGRRVTRARGSG